MFSNIKPLSNTEVRYYDYYIYIYLKDASPTTLGMNLANA